MEPLLQRWHAGGKLPAKAEAVGGSSSFPNVPWNRKRGSQKRFVFKVVFLGGPILCTVVNRPLEIGMHGHLGLSGECPLSRLEVVYIISQAARQAGEQWHVCVPLSNHKHCLWTFEST